MIARFLNYAAAIAFLPLAAAPELAGGQTPAVDGESRNIQVVASGRQKWALLIGAGDYAEIAKLSDCAADMRALQSRLIAVGFPPGNVFLMSDREQPKYLPTKANMDRQLQLVTRLAGEDDLLAVVWCGRVVHNVDTSYLCPVDARLKSPNATLFAVRELLQILSACKAKRKLLVVDPYPLQPKAAPEALQRFLESLERPPQGVTVLCSCQPGQLSRLEQEPAGSLFLHVLAKGLEGDADREAGNGDGTVLLAELVKYARTKIAARTGGGAAPSPTVYPESIPEVDLGRTPKYLPASEAYPTLPPDPTAALARLEAISAINPQSLKALNQAIALKTQADLPEAVAAATSAIESDPKNAWAYIVRAGCYARQGDAARALEDCRQLGIPLPGRVDVRSTELKDGEATIATLYLGEKIYVSKVSGEWLWVKTGMGPDAKSGWIYKSHVALGGTFGPKMPE